MNEKEAIENVKEQLEGIKKANKCGLATRGEFNKDINAIETVLNLLEKKDEIIKNQSYTNKKMRKKLQGYRKLLKLKERQLQKKDKQIDLMAEDIAFSEEINSYEDIKTYKKKIKQYFERKVEEDK